MASIKRRKNPPARKPIAAGNQARLPYEVSAYSIEGCKSDQNEAAIMTPAAKPIMMSSNLRLICLKKKTMADPTMVQPHVNNPARKACKTTDCD